MSVTKDGFYNIEGKMFEVVHGVEGDCLTLGDEDGGTRISGPKPWGGGQVTKTFVTQEKYGPIERLEAENAKLRAERDYLLANSNPTATELRRVRSAWKKDRDENAKLREQVVQLKNDWESERDYADQMEANEKRAVSDNSKLRVENAKMRELVKAFDWCTENFDLPCKCDSCPLGQSDKLTPECEVRMRELGIARTVA